MKKFLCCLAGVAFAFPAISQERILPKGFTPEEKRMSPASYNSNAGSRAVVTTPPSFPVRTMAQWEEVQSLVITWAGYASVQAQIVDAAQEECEVIIHCSDSNQVISYLSGQGIPLTNLTFLEVPYNSIWIRDYGAHTVYKNEVDSLFLVEWIYNRPRPDDDAMPEAYAGYKNITLFGTTVAPNDLVNTGGNWMVDGFGTAFASKLILDENDASNPYGVTSKSEADIDTIMSKFMGIDRYIKMETLPYDDIHHIDMHIKLMNEELLLVGEFPDGISDGPQIEANLQYVLSTFNSVFGTPYKVVRIPMPPSTGGSYAGSPFGNGYYRTYANNVIINKTILVPVYRTEYDTTALRILGEIMPGYNIVGIDVDNSGSNLISAGGAIHCITNLIGVSDPLLISHQQLPDTYDDVNPYTVNAYITHKTGINSAELYYSTTAGSSYTPVTMTATGGNYWTADIPALPVGTEVFYYISAQAVNGKQQVRPLVAPDGYFNFRILDSSSVGITENEPEGLMNIFPNPAAAITCIPAEFSEGGEVSLKMFDVLGNLVHIIYQGEVSPGPRNFFINADEFAAGAYLVVLESADKRSVRQLMIR